MQHRIHVDAVIQPGATIDVAGSELHHAARVARMREGESVEVFDGQGTAATARVEAIGRDAMRLIVGDMLPSRESKRPIDLAMSIIQLEKFELVLQKATELGVRTLLPMVTDRVEVRAERYRGKHERWQKIVFEAVKQSGRSVIPSLLEPQPFDAIAARPGLRIVFDADTPRSEEIEDEQAVTLLIGPEGGWSERELEHARASGCRFEVLGPRRLRAETAAIVAMALMESRVWHEVEGRNDR